MAARVARPPRETWFAETQRFSRGVFMLLAPGSILLSVIAGIQLLGGRPVGNNPAPDLVLFILWALIGIGLPLLFGITRMETRVGPGGVYLRVFPYHLQFRCWSFDEIERTKPRTFSPFLEYGGWGIRLTPNGWAYITSGKSGVELFLRSGKRVMLGSRDAEQLAAAIEKGRSK